MMKFIFLIALIVVALGYFKLNSSKNIAKNSEKEHNITTQVTTDNSSNVLGKTFKSRKSNIQVKGEGIVIKILPDDTKGNRHQRFILKLSTGQTLLIAHNIDLAPRVGSLKRGDKVQFYGEYDWNAKGGVMHWTHHDPKRKHTGGWLKHKGRTYQ